MYFSQDVRGLPLGLFPFTFRSRTFFVVVFSSHLFTWPNHLIIGLSVCMVSMNGLILNSSYMSALRSLSLLVTPFTNLSTFMSAAVISLFSFFVSIQDSCLWRAVFTFIHWIADISNWSAHISNSIADIYNWFADIYNSIGDIYKYTVFADISNWIVDTIGDICKSIVDICNSIGDISNSIGDIYKYGLFEDISNWIVDTPCTVCPPYNVPRYNADSGITRSTVAPEN